MPIPNKMQSEPEQTFVRAQVLFWAQHKTVWSMYKHPMALRLNGASKAAATSSRGTHLVIIYLKTLSAATKTKDEGDTSIFMFAIQKS